MHSLTLQLSRMDPLWSSVTYWWIKGVLHTCGNENAACGSEFDQSQDSVCYGQDNLLFIYFTEIPNCSLLASNEMNVTLGELEDPEIWISFFYYLLLLSLLSRLKV